MTDAHSRLMWVAGLAAALPLAAEFRVARPEQHVSGRWQDMHVESAARVPLGTSFRPLQALALGLEPKDVLADLIGYPFAVIRLAAY